VSSYDQNILATYRDMFPSAEDQETIRFRGLTEMFFANSDTQNTFHQEWSRSFHIEHPIHSKLSPKTELARQIMMVGFQSSKEHFRQLISEQHPPTLSLYRGQARFMQDDLSNPLFLAMSNKQKKKLSFTVAAEMIARNQAYSNVLELLLPNYVRLSIHAHSNRGPKFGICLFPRDKVHAIDAIVDRNVLCPSYEFQVPTPWHNSIIKIEGDDVLYLGKAEIVHKAIEQGDFQGGWVEDPVEGGHFALRPTFTVCNPPLTSTESSSISTIYMNYNDKQPATVKGENVKMVVVGSSRDGSRMGFSFRLRGKMYRILELSRFLVRRVTKDKSELRSGKRGLAVSSH
jgi:pyoverdine/dityrosine biosynthesis protein Dit1